MSQDLEKNLGGHNANQFSEEFNNAYWTKENLTIGTNSTVAPNGTTTADTFTDNGTNGRHRVYSGQVVTTGGRISVGSVYIKRGTAQFATVMVSGDSQRYYYCVIDLITGEITQTGTEGGGTYIDSGVFLDNDGWYRVYVSGEHPIADTGYYLNVGISNTATPGGIASYAGSGSTMFVWGGQLEFDITKPGPYTPTTSISTAIPYFQDGYKIHRFTTAGETSFVPALAGNIEVLVVAGGGGGGGGFGTWAAGGGGGAGGLIHREVYPVDAFKRYKVVVGNGGTGGPSTTRATNGENSQFGDLIAIGGGRGARWDSGGLPSTAGSGGSGGGGQNASGYFQGGGSVYGQGNAGGNGNRDGQEQGGTAQNSYTGTNASSGAGGGGAGGKGGPHRLGRCRFCPR
jgi:hypothetical protein